MGTRFYFPASGLDYPNNLNVNLSPAYSGLWTVDPTPAPGRSRSAFFTPQGVSGNYNQVRQGAANPYYEDLQLYVSEPIPATTFSAGQQWQGQFLCSNTAGALGSVTGACVIRLMSNDCSVSRGTLLTWKPTGIGGPDANNGTAWAASDTNRILPPPLTSAAIVGYNGDRLVFEIGYSLFSAAAGFRAQINFNASGSTDLTLADQTQTDTSLNGFIEYTGTIFTGRTCRTRSTT